MKELVFATNNKHKLQEVQQIVGAKFKIVSLAELGCNDEIPETASTLEGNSLMKAQYIHDKYKVDCFADDTGLEIEALNGRPGVYSARYAGEHCSFQDNINKILQQMQGIENRKAKFRTVITLILDNRIHYFEGFINGVITKTQVGMSGFGYDPVFIPQNYTETFAEMNAEEKNIISHRGMATRKLAAFLTEL